MRFTENDKRCFECLQEVMKIVEDIETKSKIRKIMEDLLIEKTGIVEDWIKDDEDFDYYSDDFGNYCESYCIQKIDAFMKSFTNTILYDMCTRLKNAGYLYSYTHVDDKGRKCVKVIMETHPYYEHLFYTSKDVDEFIMRNPITVPF